VLTDPVEDLRKAEFVSIHRSVDKRLSVQAFDLNVKAIASQDDIGGSESDGGLLPSRKPWLLPSDSIRAAASSWMEL